VWKVLKTFATIKTNWLQLIGESIKDDQGNILEYWRVEKADSLILLPIYKEKIVLLKPLYRPGIGKYTLDFPGGRINREKSLKESAKNILERELNVSANKINKLQQINKDGWIINSSFSNQKLYAFTVEINNSFKFKNKEKISFFKLNEQGVSDLLHKLECLQCRSVLLSWLRQEEYEN